MRVAIGGSCNDWYKYGAGGVAYIGVFGVRAGWGGVRQGGRVFVVVCGSCQLLRQGVARALQGLRVRRAGPLQQRSFYPPNPSYPARRPAQMAYFMPAFVFPAELAGGLSKFLGDAISHEVLRGNPSGRIRAAAWAHLRGWPALGREGPMLSGKCHHTTPYHTIPHHTTPYHTIPHHTIPYHTIPYHTIPHHTTPHHTIPYHTIPYHTIPYHTIPYHTIPYHTIPYHTIPYHTIITCSAAIKGRGCAPRAGDTKHSASPPQSMRS
jgi:hypothetical protein